MFARPRRPELGRKSRAISRAAAISSTTSARSSVVGLNPMLTGLATRGKTASTASSTNSARRVSPRNHSPAGAMTATATRISALNGANAAAAPRINAASAAATGTNQAGRVNSAGFSPPGDCTGDAPVHLQNTRVTEP